MAGSPLHEGKPSSQKKSGSARTSKKSKRKNLIRYENWSEEQQSIHPNARVFQKPVQDAKFDVGAGFKATGEANEMIPAASDKSTDVQKQAQDIESGSGTSPEFAGSAEAVIPAASDSPTEVQEQAQGVEADHGFDREAEAVIPADCGISPGTSTSEYQSVDTSLDDFVTTAESLSPPDAQYKGSPSINSHSPTTSG